MQSDPLGRYRRDLRRGRSISHGEPVLGVQRVHVLQLFLDRVTTSKGLPQSDGAELGRRSHKVRRIVSHSFFERQQTEPGRTRVTLRRIGRLQRLVRQYLAGGIASLDRT